MEVVIGFFELDNEISLNPSTHYCDFWVVVEAVGCSIILVIHLSLNTRPLLIALIKCFKMHVLNQVSMLIVYFGVSLRNEHEWV